MSTTTDRPPLTPAEYARALGHTRALASIDITAELDTLRAQRAAIADTKRRLSEEEAALKTRHTRILTTTPAEPTTTIHPAAATLTAPTPPATRTPNRVLPSYTPTISPRPRLPLPALNPKDPESVRAWAMRRWPDPPKRARLRLRLAAADAELWHA